MFESLSWVAEALGERRQQQLLRARRCVTPLPDGWCEVDGRQLRNFASNDYLNLAQDPRLIEAARTALSTGGVGAKASALVSGRTPWHAQLEHVLAAFEHQEAAVVFPTGYAANVGTLTALIGREDVVFCDRLNHASLIDGCRLSQARMRVYRHDALRKLEDHLQSATGFRRRYIVTDTVFSMDGDIAPLAALCDLADRHEAILIVDEAHGTGVFGEMGRGVCEACGIEDRVPVRIGTLSKAVGSAGGFVSGAQSLVDYLWNEARTQVFSTASPPPICAASSAAIEIIQTEPQRRIHLHALGEQFLRALQESSIRVPTGVTGPIVPIILNDPEAAVAVAGTLAERGFLVAAIRPPTVPAGTSRLRITLTAGHDEQAVTSLAAEIADALNARMK